MPVRIHNKDYQTVAERIQKAGKDLISVETEILNETPVVIKATITTSKGRFSGISAANPAKAIEKASPYEVAETSAVGRALAFAGYGSVDGIASADEMGKGDTFDPEVPMPSPSFRCEICGTTGKYHKIGCPNRKE